MSAARPLVLAAAVVVVDTATKLLLTTPPRLHHDRPLWVALAAAPALLVAARVAWRNPHLLLPLTLVVAGGLCNLAWIVLVDGGPDPFIAIRGDTFVAFNLADVSIATGVLWAAFVAIGAPLRRSLASG
jgi:lipoprotein signal peptidase